MIYFLYIFAAIGFVCTVWNIVIPICDWILRMLGYGIFRLRISPWSKAKSWRHILKYIFVAIPRDCIRESRTLGSVWASEITSSGVTWRPYFNYKTTNKSPNKLTKL